MTPNDIEVLIHCYCHAGKHPRSDAPAVKKTFEMLNNNGLIYYCNGEYKTTRKGAAHIKQLCSLPFPREAFIRFDGEEIII